MRYFKEGTKIFTKRGAIDFWWLNSSDEIMVMDSELRARWVKNFINPEIKVKSYKLYDLYAFDITDDLVVQRSFDTRVHVSGDSDVVVQIDGELQVMIAEDLFRLIRRCHKGKKHDIRLLSWGRNIRRKDKFDTVISAPLDYLKSRKYGEMLRELWMLDIPSDLFVLLQFEDKTAFC